MSYVPKRALVFTPHPDDAEIGAGGTIANWINQGAEVTIVVCTNGDKGSSDPEMTSERLADIREKEQLEAAKVLGVKEVVFLRHPDGAIEDTLELRRDVVREIRRVKPDVVLTTDPTRRTFYQHRDHRITGQVTMDAVFPLARDHLNFPELKEQDLEPHKTEFMYLWGADEPDTFVDISETLELKMGALKKHASQIAAEREAEFGKFLKERAKQAGEAKGMEAAESFRVVQFRR